MMNQALLLLKAELKTRTSCRLYSRQPKGIIISHKSPRFRIIIR